MSFVNILTKRIYQCVLQFDPLLSDKALGFNEFIQRVPIVFIRFREAIDGQRRNV